VSDEERAIKALRDSSWIASRNDNVIRSVTAALAAVRAEERERAIVAIYSVIDCGAADEIAAAILTRTPDP
jgi:hypothetical protein